MTHTVRIDKDVDIDEINFTVKKGICILIVNDEKVEVFSDNNKIKVINNPPLDSSMELSCGYKVYFSNKKVLYSVSLK